MGTPGVRVFVVGFAVRNSTICTKDMGYSTGSRNALDVTRGGDNVKGVDSKSAE